MNIWNFLDLLRLIMMALYIVFTFMYLGNRPQDDEERAHTVSLNSLFSNKVETDTEVIQLDSTEGKNWDEIRAETFTLLVLVSFVGLLQYFRLLSKYRALIKMIIECTKESLTFIVVLLVLLVGFTLATYFRQILYHGEEETGLASHTYATFMTALGDFESQTETLNSIVLYFIFVASTVLILIVMMNLLIGIISEKLAEVLEQKEKNDFYELCQLLNDLENIMFWKRNWVPIESWNRHFTWAVYQQQSETWEGRVRATTGPINKLVNSQSKKQETANTHIDAKLCRVEETLETVNSELRTAVNNSQQRMMTKIMEFEVQSTTSFKTIGGVYGEQGTDLKD